MPRAPRYRVIYDDIVSQIRDGRLPAGAQLPNENDLARRYGVSRMTVRQSLDMLDAERYVVRRQGSGTFVAERRSGRHLNRLQSFGDELAADDVDVTSETIHFEEYPVPPDIADLFGIRADDIAHRVKRIRKVGGVPAALQDAWIPYAVAPALTRESLLEDSLYRTLTGRYGVELSHADQELTAVGLSADHAARLGAEEGAPALESRRITYAADGNVVERVTSWTLQEFPLLLRIEAQ
ncbi:GntR family transcriptional regulator [Nesterenkonia ebinurensis]|uniref:GntR family transcriptional regulator n=1 Tax=Nesterenkonia ebinurensis TaxID=2608252 RepID=UPI00123DFD32|nr:GntR family transcriptional regulator [Nesterenkonia ebinurensis]